MPGTTPTSTTQQHQQRRTTSGAITQLDGRQIRQLKEAFTLLDQSGTGTVTAPALAEMLVSLGQDPAQADAEATAMLELMPQPLTFSSFLTGMGMLLGGVAGETDLLEAFAAFETSSPGSAMPSSPTKNSTTNGSKSTKGGSSSSSSNIEDARIHVDELREMLLETGMSASEVDTCFKPFLKAGGLAGDWFYYGEFVSMMKGGGLGDE